MADNKVNALVENWNTKASLNLAGDQEEKVNKVLILGKKNNKFLYLVQLKALLNTAVEKYRGRREAGKHAVEQLQTAVQGGDNATVEQVLKKFREGLSQAAEGREKFLDQFDQVLQPEQRAKLLLFLVQRAKETGKPIEQLVDNLLIQGGEDN